MNAIEYYNANHTQPVGYVAPQYLYTFTFAKFEISVLAYSQSEAVNEVNLMIGNERWLRLHKSPERFIIK